MRPELADFGKELMSAGFRVYVFRSDQDRVAKGGREGCATTLGFSRQVEGRECFGSVSFGLSGFQFSMPIKPSTKHGSAMFISKADRAPEFDDLTLTNAELYASPTGYNPLVGTHENHPDWVLDIYVEVVA